MNVPRLTAPLAHALGWLALVVSSGLRAEVSTAPLPLPSPLPGTATVLEINGPIGPATSRYVVHGIEAARARGSRLVVLELDTPGGLDSSMRDIIRAILASPVPVVSYVTPSGARAASAGTYILYASHVAAMAPATNLGAATPVAIGGERGPPAAPAPLPGGAPPGKGAPAGGAPAPPGEPGGAEAPPEPSGSAMEHKVVNDAVAYIRGLAELRGRNAEWAEQAVRGAASLSATQALQQNVIDVIARDLPGSAHAHRRPRGARSTIAPMKLATRGLQVEHAEAGLAHAAAGGHHQPHGRLRADADRHLGAAARGLQPRRGAAGRGRLDLPADRAVRLPDPVGELRGPRAGRGSASA